MLLLLTDGHNNNRQQPSASSIFVREYHLRSTSYEIRQEAHSRQAYNQRRSPYLYNTHMREPRTIVSRYPLPLFGTGINKQTTIKYSVWYSTAAVVVRIQVMSVPKTCWPEIYLLSWTNEVLVCTTTNNVRKPRSARQLDDKKDAAFYKELLLS